MHYHFVSQPMGTAKGACSQAKYLPEASSLQLESETDPKLKVQYSTPKSGGARQRRTEASIISKHKSWNVECTDPRVTIGNRIYLTCRLPGPPSRVSTRSTAQLSRRSFANIIPSERASEIRFRLDPQTRSKSAGDYVGTQASSMRCQMSEVKGQMSDGH